MVVFINLILYYFILMITNVTYAVQAFQTLSCKLCLTETINLDYISCIFQSKQTLVLDSLFFFQFHGAPMYFTDILSYFNLFFTMLFTIECVFKLVSFGPRVRKCSYVQCIHINILHRFDANFSKLLHYSLLHYSHCLYYSKEAPFYKPFHRIYSPPSSKCWEFLFRLSLTLHHHSNTWFLK